MDEYWKQLDECSNCGGKYTSASLSFDIGKDGKMIRLCDGCEELLHGIKKPLPPTHPDYWE